MNKLHECRKLMRQSLDLVWQQAPRMCREFFPKRWHMPPNHANPEMFLPGFWAQVFAHENLRGSPRCYRAWRHCADGLKTYATRVYVISPWLAQDLWYTEPKGFSFSLLHLPIPAFLLSLPHNLFTTQNDGSMQLIAVHVGQDFSICATLESGASYTFACASKDSELTRIMEEDTIEYSVDESALPEGMQLRSPEDEDKLHHITRFVLNLLAWMSQPKPSLTTESQLHRKIPRPKSSTAIPKRDFWTPFVIGADYRSEIRSGHQPIQVGQRGPVRMHWRSGHWRNQACGKNWSQHRLIHVAPILVNAG